MASPSDTRLTREQWQERERVLDQAIAAGKFPHSRRQHYAQMYDADPAGTTRLIGMLAAGLPPQDADPEAYPEEWLTPAERAVKAGRRSEVITHERGPEA